MQYSQQLPIEIKPRICRMRAEARQLFLHKLKIQVDANDKTEGFSDRRGTNATRSIAAVSNDAPYINGYLGCTPVDPQFID